MSERSGYDPSYPIQLEFIRNQLFSHRKNLYKASKVHLVPGRYFQYLSIDNPHEFRL